MELNKNAQAMFAEMLGNQAALNTKSYSTEWVAKAETREFDYPLAGAQEVAEFINSFGYSWWSKPAGNLAVQPIDRSNCITELVDAIHFMLAQRIVECKGDIADGALLMKNEYMLGQSISESYQARDWSRLLGARLLIQGLRGEADELGRGYTSYHPWVLLFACADSMNVGLEQLYTRYMAKSVLNAFRQENGYKQGTYKKLWDGKNEDNYFVAEWVDGLEHTPTKEEIHEWLTAQYAQHTAENQA